MKNLNFVIVAVFIILTAVFASFGQYSEIADYDVVSGVAIDKLSEKWQVTCEIYSPSSNNDFGSKSVYVKGTGFTLELAIEDAAHQSPNELYLDSVQLYLVNESLKGDASVHEYFKGESINMRAVVVYTQNEAFEQLETEDEENDRTKSISFVKKINGFARSEGIASPNVFEFMKNKNIITLTSSKAFERSVNTVG